MWPLWRSVLRGRLPNQMGGGGGSFGSTLLFIWHSLHFGVCGVLLLIIYATIYWLFMRTVRNQPRTTREDLVNDLKTAGTRFTKRTIGNTLCLEGLKTCSARKVPLLKKAHVQPVWSLPMIQRRTGWKCCGQMRPNPALWHQLNSPCLEEEECCLWPQEHHPHRQTWRWKHYALRVFCY